MPKKQKQNELSDKVGEILFNLCERIIKDDGEVTQISIEEEVNQITALYKQELDKVIQSIKKNQLRDRELGKKTKEENWEKTLESFEPEWYQDMTIMKAFIRKTIKQEMEKRENDIISFYEEEIKKEVDRATRKQNK